MDRDEFMELVYETFADEPDNVLANGIIEAADAYVEHEKAQLSKEGTTYDTISRQVAIDAFDKAPFGYLPDKWMSIKTLEGLPPAQPEREEGEWIPVTNGRGGHECNKCHEYAPSYQNGDEHLTKFCPYCGTKMKEAQNETG